MIYTNKVTQTYRIKLSVIGQRAFILIHRCLSYFYFYFIYVFFLTFSLQYSFFFLNKLYSRIKVFVDRSQHVNHCQQKTWNIKTHVHSVKQDEQRLNLGILIFTSYEPTIN